MKETLDIQTLIDTALVGKHKEFHPISSYSEFITAKQTKKALTKIIKIFNRLHNQFFSEYLKAGYKLPELDKLDKLITVRNMNICAEFYTEEVHLLTNTIAEYRVYLRNPANFVISED